MKIRTSLTVVLLLGTAFANPATAQMPVPTETVSLHAGGEVTVQHKIVGKDIYGYTFAGMAGQSVTVTLDAVTPSANFMLTQAGQMPPLFTSMSGERTTTQILPIDGEYEIRLFLVGQASETGSSDMKLTISLGGAGAEIGGTAPKAGAAPVSDFADGMTGGPDYWAVYGIANEGVLNIRSGAGTQNPVVGTVRNGDVLRNMGCAGAGSAIWCQVEATDGSKLKGWASNAYLRETGMADDTGDALVEGTSYNAVGSIPCKIEANSSVSSCEFGVTRGRTGMATVFITLPNGFERVIEFSDDTAAPMSAVTSFQTSRSGDETTVTIDNGAEIYTIPDAVVFGG